MATIRPAVPADADQVAAIYNEGIAERTATFETKLSGAADVREWLRAGERLPLLVAEDDGVVVGFARILGYSHVRAYAGVGEVSIYVTAAARGRGTGRTLLEGIQDAARELGYWKLIGKLFADNAASARLMHGSGWRDVGTHLRHAQLDGEWRDVLLVERAL